MFQKSRLFLGWFIWYLFFGCWKYYSPWIIFDKFFSYRYFIFRILRQRNPDCITDTLWKKSPNSWSRPDSSILTLPSFSDTKMERIGKTLFNHHSYQSSCRFNHYGSIGWLHWKDKIMEIFNVEDLYKFHRRDSHPCRSISIPCHYPVRQWTMINSNPDSGFI